MMGRIQDAAVCNDSEKIANPNKPTGLFADLSLHQSDPKLYILHDFPLKRCERHAYLTFPDQQTVFVYDYD